MDENKKEQITTENYDKGPLWAILLTVVMVVIMAILSRHIG